MAPFLLESVLDLLEKSRNTIFDFKSHAITPPNKKDAKEIDFFSKDDSSVVLNKEGKNALLNDAVFQNGKTFWEKSCSELYASLVTSLLNLAIINNDNAKYFAKNGRLIGEISEWISGEGKIDDIWYEVTLNYIELLEMMCGNAEDDKIEEIGRQVYD
ncbi:hypothetical protein AYI68_g5795 [Smittium mucronatum]|uniref:Uncharacterized protein n=1 Tax=Smittium mucronatum TaxID=133383 RepID=A0A1R0GTA0_9FUNG|nr:hypothetical protein AYI68_g5795 [Smittium mucronatum]